MSPAETSMNPSAEPRELKAHPIAECFPMMQAEELSSLVASIQRSGLRSSIVIYEGKILDGRNRYLACQKAGVAPKFIDLPAGTNPWLYVWDHNAERRELPALQKGCLRLKFDEGAEAYEAAIKKAADAKRTEGRRPDGTFGGKSPSSPTSGTTAREREHHSSNRLATAAGIGRGTADTALALKHKAPDIFEAVCAGKLKGAEAVRQVKRQELAKRGVEALPSDKYRVIYADPPWQYSDSRADLDGYSATAAEDHYPTMSVAQLCALDVGRLAEDDSVLFCWATFPLLPDALQVVREWGFKYKTAFVWAKGRPNFGHYHTANAELLLVCTRGSGVPDSDKRESQVQIVERTGKHSAKPEEFRALIDRLYTHGTRIELFRRGDAPSGWSIWGNEAVAGA